MAWVSDASDGRQSRWVSRAKAGFLRVMPAQAGIHAHGPTRPGFPLARSDGFGVGQAAGAVSICCLKRRRATLSIQRKPTRRSAPVPGTPGRNSMRQSIAVPRRRTHRHTPEMVPQGSEVAHAVAVRVRRVPRDDLLAHRGPDTAHDADGAKAVAVRRARWIECDLTAERATMPPSPRVP